MAKTIRTEDLGLGWFASENTDGSMDIRNPDLGQRIHLKLESVELLRECFRKTEAVQA